MTRKQEDKFELLVLMTDSDISDPTSTGRTTSITPISGISPISPITALPHALPPSIRKVNPVEVAGYWINNFKRCRQSRLEFCNALVGGFAGAMRSQGHKVATVKGEQDASPLQWNTATDKNTAGIDTVEFAYLATHGSTYGTELPFNQSLQKSQWLHWFIATFDSPDGCIISTIQVDPKNWKPPDATKPVTKIRLGEGRVRWVVLDSCRSLQVRLENERNQEARTKLAESDPGQTWGRCYAGVQMLFGFTGLSSDAAWTCQRGTSFGIRAGRGEPLADTWLEEAYSYWVDDVPVVTAFGETPSETDQRVKSETLANGKQSATNQPGGHVYTTIWRS
jgi:hypothetical protein